MRDLLGEPVEVWDPERRRVGVDGWAAEMLEHRTPANDWPKGCWTNSPWSLLLLVACGIPAGHVAAGADADRLVGRFMPQGGEVDGAFPLKRVDLRHLGFWLGLGAYFLAGDPRLSRLAEAVVSAQLDDGGWNLPDA